MLDSQSRLAGWRVRRYAIDALVALSAWYGAAWLRMTIPLPWTRFLLPPGKLVLVHQATFLVVALQWVLLYFFGFYDRPSPRPKLQILTRLAGLATIQALVLAAWVFLANREFPRSVLLVYLVLYLVLIVGWRWIEQGFYRPERYRIALVGTGAQARELEARIEEEHLHGLEVAGYFDAGGSQPGETALRSPRLGSLEDLPLRLDEDRFDALVLVARTDDWETRLLDQVSRQRPDHLSVLLLPGPFESMIGSMRYRWVNDLPLIEVVTSADRHRQRPWKRLLDLILGSALLAFTLPVMAACAAAVATTSRGGVFYRQTRVGRDREPFTVVKFRTMRTDAEAGEELLAKPGDPRLTPVGGLLRRMRLDELPQLFLVLTGRMSLVGPRPERPGFVEQYLERVPGYAERFLVAPGLTGLAQVNGEYHSTPENKLRYDLAYIANASLWLDLTILFRTVKIVLTTRGI